MSAASGWVERLQRATIPLPRCPGLTPDERVVVAAVRQMVVAGLGAPGAAEAIALKSDSLLVLEALREWLGLLAGYTVRQIAVGAPTHCCASPDELAMLAAIDGARRGDFALVHSLLGRFVDAEHVDALAHASEILGEQLAKAGFTLTMRQLPAVAR